MKIVSYNLNGIRAASKLDLISWLKAFDADIYMFQETRATKEQCLDVLNELNGYYMYFNDSKKLGYSGTAILTKVEPLDIVFGLPNESDDEGRTITCYFENFVLVNVYTPNGGTRLDFKIKYYDKLISYVETLTQNNRLILGGDMNIAHEKIDLSHPKECKNSSGFLKIERDKFDELLERGLLKDGYREIYQNAIQYSWRSYRSRIDNAYNSYKYRFDYMLINENFFENLIDCQILDLEYSDHLPCILNIDSNIF